MDPVRRIAVLALMATAAFGQLAFGQLTTDQKTSDFMNVVAV